MRNTSAVATMIQATSAALYLPSSKLGRVGTNRTAIDTMVNSRKGAKLLKVTLLIVQLI